MESDIRGKGNLDVSCIRGLELERDTYIVDQQGEVLKVINNLNLFNCEVGCIKKGRKYKKEIPKSSIKRHATEEEVWWAKRGRNVWELRENDVISINDILFKIKEVCEDEMWMDNGVTGTELISSEEIDSLIKVGNVEVVCFVENREDV